MDFDPARPWESFAAHARTGAPGLAPFVDAAERFATAAKNYFDTTQTSEAHPGAAAAMFGNFLRDQFADVMKAPWTVALETVADAPALGLTREHQERAQRGADAWRRLADAQGRLQRLWSDTLRDAAAAFAAQLSPPPSSLDADTLNRLYDTWIDCAEEAYARTAHSDAFCEALADHVNASAHWRRECSANLEQWAKLFDLPTRSEFDSLTEQLRALEQELAAMRSKRTRAKP